MKKIIICFVLVCLSFASCREPSDYVSLIAVHLNKNTLEMRAGDKETLTAKIVPQKASLRELLWTSSDETVASVTNGVVTALTAGRVTITVSLESGESTDCSVTVMPGLNSVITGIQVTSMPDKTFYFLGDEFDIRGLAVNVVYSDNVTAAVHITEDNITGFDSEYPGDKILTITYGSVSAQFSVLVVQVTEIAVTQMPDKIQYNRNEPLDVTGLILSANYFDGAQLITGDIIAGIENYISGFDSSRPGSVTVTIVYGGIYAEFSVVITGVGSISILQLPNKNEYRIGENLSLEGLVVEAFYTEGGSEIIANNSLTVTGFDNYTPGDKTIEVSYGGAASSFTVNVIGVRSISIINPPDKLIYKTGDTLDISGIVVEAVLTNGEAEIVTIIPSYITGFFTNRAGVIPLTVNYGAAAAEFEVTIAVLSEIEVTRLPNKINYKIGEVLDITGIIVSASYTYEDIRITGDLDHLAISASNVSGFNSLSSGVKELTVMYRGIQTKFNITVLNINSIVLSNPEKTIYKIGETFDITGLTATAVYTDGETGQFSVPLSAVTGFSSASAGNKTLTVTIGGISETFIVTVTEITNLSITRFPYKRDYTVGEALSLAGLEVEATYAGGSVTFKEQLIVTSSNISGFDTSTVGVKTLTIINAVNYVSFTIDVIRSIERIEVIRLPDKTQFVLGVNYTIYDTAGLEVKAYYNDGSWEILGYDRVSVTGFNSAVLGNQNLVVTYMGKSDIFTVNVGRQEVFDITFEIIDHAPVINGPVIYLSGGAKTANLSVTDPQQYSSIVWFLTKAPVRVSGSSFTLDSSNNAYNSAGLYFLTLEVVKNGVPYSTTIQFEVRL